MFMLERNRLLNPHIRRIILVLNKSHQEKNNMLEKKEKKACRCNSPDKCNVFSFIDLEYMSIIQYNDTYRTRKLENRFFREELIYLMHRQSILFLYTKKTFIFLWFVFKHIWVLALQLYFMGKPGAELEEQQIVIMSCTKKGVTYYLPASNRQWKKMPRVESCLY